MFSKCSPPIHKKVLQNHFHVILSDLSLDAPGRPCTVSKYYLKKCSQHFHPPPSQKVLQNHFQVILSDLSLDAPVRPCTPLYAPVRPYAPVSKRVLLDEPGRRGVSPPPLIQYPWYTILSTTFVKCNRYMVVLSRISRHFVTAINVS